MTDTILTRPTGEITVRSANADNTVVSRRVIVPGSFVSAAWVDTDVSGESAAVRATAAALWTPAVVSAYQAAHPWIVPDPVAVAAAQRIAAFQADTNRQAMLAALTSATPAQVQTYINNNFTDLPSAKVMLYKIALILATLATS